MQIGKEEVKLFLFEDDMIVYVVNPKASTKIATKYNKHRKCKLDIRKLIVFQ